MCFNAVIKKGVVMPDQSKPLLIFDLDETLMHCEEKDFREAEHSTEYGFVAVRPGVDEMLDQLASHYDFMIWSNNGRPYIDRLLGLLWPAHHKLIDIFTSSDSGRLVRDAMAVPFFKETRKVIKRHPQYDLNRALGVDDNVGVYRRNYGNLVQVTPFTGPYNDELARLSKFLLSIADEPDLRKIEKRYWRSSRPRADLDSPSPG